ncbi:cytochrome c maturation protein CcmE [Marivirga sp. S37H4]|uniref:Cytochrome c maturation protein CcmE n=1 Tax=Marivirga aurantiaca TaxID=2802615 RepID=A0A934WZ85_9BACT|nr:cytochrome c maturation protein CcmE [Marivirga aurantiaca]MBK6265923.1 cytochrome c maturation protein CcmE [Marivirga aurantiaca]
MKKSYIFGIIIIAAAIMMIVSTAGDASSYVSFKDAHDMALNGNNTKIHVVGELKKDNEGKVLGINTSQDKLSFTFIMVDENGKEQEVFYNEPMPADFTRSEQVVVIGSFKNESFVADKILMKCPSKYQEETVI